VKKLLLGSIAVLSVAGVHCAVAGDMPVKAPPPAQAAFNWTGWYAGVTAGAAQGQYDPRTSMSTGGYIPAAADAAIVTAAGSQTIKPTGFVAGIEGGYNWQVGNWLLGVEGDVQAVHLIGAASSYAVPYATAFGPGVFTVTSYGNSDWLLTARPRIGFLTPQHWLLYATGGLALTQLQSDFSYVDASIGFEFENARLNTLKAGYAVGAGIEAPLTDRLSLKAEYLHVGFGNTAGAETANALGNVPPQEVFAHSSDLKADMVRAGLNYHFGDPGAAPGGGPIIALKAPTPPVFTDWQVETGSRLWLSSGRDQEGPLFSAPPPVLLSFLTYSNLDSVAGEVFARADHASGFFVKGNLGAGGIGNGHLDDEDFPATVYSNTYSSASGHIGYATIDGGYNFLTTPGAKLGAFVGYNYYTQGINNYGCAQIAGDPACLPASTTDLGITQYNHFNSLRIGLSSQVMLTDRLRLTADAAYLPWVNYAGVDNHLERQLPIPDADLTGNGVMLEAVLDYYITKNWSIGAGARFWAWNMSNSGTSGQNSLVTPTSNVVEPEGFSADRYGVFIQSSYRWGDPAPTVGVGTLATKASAAVARPMDWTGFYIGGHIGGGYSADRWSDPFASTVGAGGFTNVAGFGDAVDATGPLGGGQFGANWQTGPWVLGVEADASVADIKGQVSCFTGTGGLLCGRQINALGTYTGRIGYAWDRSLAYVKAGGAWIDTTYSVFGNTSALTLGIGSTTLQTGGWTVGAGLEYAITNQWTTFAEYDHIGLPSTNVGFPAVALQTVATGNNSPIAVSQSVDLFKLGVNYKFDCFAAACNTPGLAPAMPVKAPPLAYNWTGFYIGGSAGAAWGKSSVTSNLIPGGVGGVGALFGDPADIAVVNAVGTGALDAISGIGGGQIGYNWQVAPTWTVGVEADLNSFAQHRALSQIGETTSGPASVTNSLDSTWLATVRGRIGAPFERSLLYVTGGAAFTDLSYTQNYSDLGAPPGVGISSVKSIKAGWTVGGGGEFALADRWSMKAEYLYAQFGGQSTNTLLCAGGCGTFAQNLTGSTDKLSANIYRVGLNYRFDAR
jgi:opacity protein-like surface antigen/outer membrane protease